MSEPPRDGRSIDQSSGDAVEGADAVVGADADHGSDAVPDADAEQGTDAVPDADAEQGADADHGADDIPWFPSVGLSDDGIMLFFAGVACLLAAATAVTRGQPRAIAVTAVAAGVPGVAAFLTDVFSDYVPSTRVHLLVGAVAFLGTGFAIPGRYYANAATLGAASALVLWRYIDVEYRGAEQ